MKRALVSSLVVTVLTAVLSGAVQERRMRVPQLQAPIAQKYAELGGEGGVLGRPQGDERATPDGVGRFRHFERGSIYWHPSTGAHEVHGLIRQKWAELGWERSFLGYPTSDEIALPNRAGAYSQFQGGSIYWFAATNAIEVKKTGEPMPDVGRATGQSRDSTRPIAPPSGPAGVVVPPSDPGALGKGNAIGSLNETPWESFPNCISSIPPVVQSGLALLGKVLSSVGASSPTLDSRCGTYTREIASGVTLGAPFIGASSPPAWGYLGGRGELMAHSLLCLLKDIGDRPGGRIENRAAVPVGIGKVEMHQIVGLSKFDPAAKRAELFQVTKICAPLLGCLDAGRQNIVATVRASRPAWPAGMKSGDYGIANSYSLEVVSDWSATKVGASLPPITIVTPYGQVSAKPAFTYATSLLPIDTPFTFKKGSSVEFDFPKSHHVSTPTVQDTYGRSGVPFIVNVSSHLPPAPAGGVPPPNGWSSQLGLGGRDGAFNAQIWSPPSASLAPLRPDFDFGKARSSLERLPAAAFTAKAPVRFEPPSKSAMSLIPAPVRSIVSGVDVWVEVTPSFLADYAAQLALMSREAKLLNGCRATEAGRTCGLAESAVGLQVTANAQIQITGKVHLGINFIDGPFMPEDINIEKGFTVPLPSPGREWDPPHIGDVKQAHQSSDMGWAMHAAERADGSALWQGVKTLSGSTFDDVAQFTNACLASPPKSPAQIPEPSHQPDTGDGLVPELLPCNICVADARQTKYTPFLIFEVKNRKPDLPASVCEWQENAGCYDLCSWNGSSWNRVEVAASQILGSKCATPRPPVVK